MILEEKVKIKKILKNTFGKNNSDEMDTMKPV